MVNMNVYNVVGFLIHCLSHSKYSAEACPWVWPPENVCDFMLQNKALDSKVTMDAMF